MPFERHVFISYAHIDNEPLTPDQKGWVTRFHATLQTMLSQRIGQKADIWRDDKLAGNDVFSEQIVAQFPHTALLVSVLTPRYVRSEWCTREVREFVAAAEHTGGLVIDHKCRVFKVIKTPVDSEAPLPPVVGQLLGYEFYDLDEGHTPRDLDPLYGDLARQEFLRKLNKLAWDIAQLWEELEARARPGTESTSGTAPGTAGAPAPNAIAGRASGANLPPVFLADVGRDQRAAREMIEEELKRHGYPVLPDRQFPVEEDALRAAIDQCLAQCVFSIHLIGNSHGVVPDGPSQRSVVVLQNELAAEHSRTRALPRLIWLPTGIVGDQPAQQAFIAALQSDPQTQRGADLLTGSLESVKGSIHAALARILQARSARAEVVAEVAPHTVYLLCDERDRPDIVPLVRHLRSRGVAVTLPLFSGDAASVREANQQRLISCDAVVLYYGAGDEAWKYHQENDLRRMAALRPSRQSPPVQVWLAAPASPDKDLLRSLMEPGLVDGTGADGPAAIDPFLDRVLAQDASR
jgi:hypothetical protein